MKILMFKPIVLLFAISTLGLFLGGCGQGAESKANQEGVTPAKYGSAVAEKKKGKPKVNALDKARQGQENAFNEFVAAYNALVDGKKNFTLTSPKLQELKSKKETKLTAAIEALDQLGAVIEKEVPKIGSKKQKKLKSIQEKETELEQLLVDYLPKSRDVLSKQLEIDNLYKEWAELNNLRKIGDEEGYEITTIYGIDKVNSFIMDAETGEAGGEVNIMNRMTHTSMGVIKSYSDIAEHYYSEPSYKNSACSKDGKYVILCAIWRLNYSDTVNNDGNPIEGIGDTVSLSFLYETGTGELIDVFETANNYGLYFSDDGKYLLPRYADEWFYYIGDLISQENDSTQEKAVMEVAGKYKTAMESIDIQGFAECLVPEAKEETLSYAKHNLDSVKDQFKRMSNVKVRYVVVFGDSAKISFALKDETGDLDLVKNDGVWLLEEIFPMF